MMYVLKKADGYYIDSPFSLFSEDMQVASLLELSRAEAVQHLLRVQKSVETTIVPVKLVTQKDVDWCDKCDPIYCRVCGGCGESGCCSPAMCEQVKCLYGESNVDEFTAMQRNYDSISRTLDSVKKALANNDIEAANQALVNSDQWI